MGNVQKPTVTTKQFEDHIEYLKGELARATSQLNATRSDLQTSEETLAAAQSEIGQLREELQAARAELQGRNAGPKGPLPEPSMPSVASSFRCANHGRHLHAKLAHSSCTAFQPRGVGSGIRRRSFHWR